MIQFDRKSNWFEVLLAFRQNNMMVTIFLQKLHVKNEHQASLSLQLK